MRTSYVFGPRGPPSAKKRVAGTDQFEAANGVTAAANGVTAAANGVTAATAAAATGIGFPMKPHAASTA